MAKIHKIKIEVKYLDRIMDGSKTFEVRFNDRDYQVGDEIEFKPVNNSVPIAFDVAYENIPNFTITYILNNKVMGIDEHYVVFSIRVI